MFSGRRWGVCRVAGLVLAAATCARPGPPPAVSPSVDPAAHAPAATRAGATGADRLYVLMINGGGAPAVNYQSHLLHVRQLVDILSRAGVAGAHISILSSDGDNPAADLAVREEEVSPSFWLLEGTAVERWLQSPVVLKSSAVEGHSLGPATKTSLGRWFARARGRLRPGDTLLLYVTDHGTKGRLKDGSDNRIVLWGNDEGVTVRELGALLGTLDPGVRVVSLMSQCYSGGFARLTRTHARTAGAPGEAVCGYFSSTEDRPAYGCYPENLGRDNVGHSFLFLRGLASNGGLRSSHRDVLVGDATPDVPLRSSDVYLQDLLAAAARSRGVPMEGLVDDLLREAWREGAAFEPEVRLLDRIGRAFGLFSPRSLREIEEQTKRLPDIGTTLDTHAEAWRSAMGDMTSAGLQRFLAARPEWSSQLDAGKLRRLSPSDRRGLTGDLLGQLEAFARNSAPSWTRLTALHEKSATAADVAYRMDVRLAVVLRMRAVLIGVAGRKYLQSRGSSAERAALAALEACEDLTLPRSAASPSSVAGSEPAAAPFPSFEEDVRLAERVLPAWLGVTFEEPPAPMRKKLGLSQPVHGGASLVRDVLPGSSAEAAGIEPGDIVLGPPGKPFAERNQLRSWTTLSPIGEPQQLELLRGSERMTLTIVLRPYPMKKPSLPGPPAVGAKAPPFETLAYRGKVPATLVGDGPHLLFFWATWCGPCKESLPEVLAYARERNTPVIAVTDEPAEVLDPFFSHFDRPFPDAVAIDQHRRVFRDFGISGFPTFVLVDAAGKIASYTSGYPGLKLPGWTWTGRR